jgi:hypothetical protein
MTFHELDTVVLTRDRPDVGLKAGDQGAIVHVHAPSDVEVEFVTASGRTQALVSLRADELRAVEDNDLLAVRVASAQGAA